MKLKRSNFALLLMLLLLLAGSFVGLAEAHPSSAAPPPSDVSRSLAADGSVVIEAAPAASLATPAGEQALTIAGPTDEIATLDPAFVRDSASAFLVRQIFRGLVRLDDRLMPVPDLARRIEISLDGRVYRFWLQPEAAFQDGRAITASDAAYSLNRAVDPATAVGDISLLGGPAFLAGIEGFDAVASGKTHALPGIAIAVDGSLAIRLSAPDSAFLMKLATPSGSIVDEKDVASGGDWWMHPNGSGPFMLSDYKALDRLTLTRNERYSAGAPALQTVNVLLGPNGLNEFNLYQSGKVDLANVGLFGIDRVLAPDAGYLDQLRTTPLFSLDYIAFDPSQAPMNDPKIREALALAVPTFKVAHVTLNDHATHAQGVIPDGMLGENWAGKVEPFDPAAAKAAIAQSTYGSVDKVPVIRVYTSGGGSAESLRDAVAETVGLKIEVIDVQWSDFVAGLPNRQFPGFELYWSADYPDPESMLTQLFGTGKPDNYLNYSNPAMDALLNEAANEIDPSKRAGLYRQAQQLLLDDHVVIPIVFDIGYTLVKPSVKGLVVTPLGIMTLDSVWLEH